METPISSAAESDPATVMAKWVLPLVIIVIGFFMSILDVTIVNVAIPAIQHAFGGPLEDVLWVATAYTLTLGIAVPLSSWLGDRFGTKTVYIWSLLGFAVGSGLCGLAWSLESLIAARILQAIPGGVLPATTLTLLYRIVPAGKVGVAMGIYGLGAMLAPAVGPVLGGYFVDYMTWRLVFDINVPIGVATAVAAYFLIPTIPRAPVKRFDYVGFVTIAVGLFAILLAASKGQDWGWTGYRILILIVTSILAIAAFVVIELEVEHPLIDVRVFKTSQFSLMLVVTTLSFINLLVATLYIPIFLQQGQNMTAFNAGLLILPQAIVMCFTIPLSGILYDKVGPRLLGGVGLLLVAYGNYLLCSMTPAMTHAEVVFWTCVRGAGIGIGVMPVMTWGISAVPARQNSQANALSNVSQQVGGALGIGALGTFLTIQQAQLTTDRAALLEPDSPLAYHAGPLIQQYQTSPSEETFAPLYQIFKIFQTDVMAMSFRNMFIVLTIVASVTVWLVLFIGPPLGRNGPKSENPHEPRQTSSPDDPDAPRVRRSLEGPDRGDDPGRRVDVRGPVQVHRSSHAEPARGVPPTCGPGRGPSEHAHSAGAREAQASRSTP